MIDWLIDLLGDELTDDRTNREELLPRKYMNMGQNTKGGKDKS